MATNEYLSFAVGPSANTLTPAAYALLASLINTGFVAGEADAQQVNTVLRQATVAASALAQFASVNSGLDALDNGDRDALALLIKQAVLAVVASSGGTEPVGSIKAWIQLTPPAGYLLLQGQPVSRTTYAALFTHFGIAYGPGDGATTFNLPDFRGQFLRGWDAGRGLDPDSGRDLGSTQGDAIRAHSHPAFRGQAPTNTGTGGIGGDNPYEGPTGLAGGAETRPTNFSVNWIVKF